jgi:hypothetical protein
MKDTRITLSVLKNLIRQEVSHFIDDLMKEQEIEVLDETISPDSLKKACNKAGYFTTDELLRLVDRAVRSAQGKLHNKPSK